VLGQAKDFDAEGAKGAEFREVFRLVVGVEEFVEEVADGVEDVVGAGW